MANFGKKKSSETKEIISELTESFSDIIRYESDYRKQKTKPKLKSKSKSKSKSKNFSDDYSPEVSFTVVL